MKAQVDNSEMDRGVSTFFEAIFDQYGYDFRDYSLSFKRNRIRHCLSLFAMHEVDELREKACAESEFFFELLGRLTITVTGLFRDPEFFLALKEKVIPQLRQLSAFKIWHPGCSSGEELISMAILLHEEGLLHECILYGTDINPRALAKARHGMVSAEVIRESSQDYYAFGGRLSLADYFQVNHGFGLFTLSRERNIVYSEHNLVTDKCFGEMQLISCRNVLIYFGEQFRDKALQLLTESLRPGGFLCLGLHESLLFSSLEKYYRVFDARNKIFQKK